MTALTTPTAPDRGVPAPTYDRTAASVGIVHFGFGNFHRSHQAMYLDRLMETGEGLDWGICGVGVLPQDVAMRDAMRAQDCLFTLVVRHPDGSLEPRVVGSVLEYLFGPDDAATVYERLARPGRADRQPDGHRGWLPQERRHRGLRRGRPVGGPRRRRTSRTRGPRSRTSSRGSGADGPPACPRSRCSPATTSRATGGGPPDRRRLRPARRPGLADWIDAEVSFPNCMVDRITPATTDADREAARPRLRHRGPLAGTRPSRSRSGSSRTSSPSGDRTWRPSTCSSSTTSRRTS